MLLLGAFATDGEEIYQRSLKIPLIPLDPGFQHPKISSSQARTTIEDLKKASSLGNLAAASRLGELYYFGLGRFMEPDYGKAVQYLSQGRSPRALFLLAILQANGLGGLDRETPRAVIQLKLAAAAGLEEANAALAYRHTNGIGLAKNCHRGRDYYFRAALAVAREHRQDPTLGHGSKSHRLTDDPKAVRGQADMIDFYQYSADNGDPAALYVLGQIYLIGIGGTPRDHTRAAAYFERAAEDGHAGACGYLGMQYQLGFGVKQDYRKAFHYFSRGAKLRNSMSQNGLGLLYWRGHEVVKVMI